MGRIIGIDLGTTNSVAAYWSKKRPKVIEYDTSLGTQYIVPSVVAVEQGKRIVGQDAKDRIASGSRNIVYSIKRLMGMDYDDERTQRVLGQVGYKARKAQNGEVEVLLGDAYYSPIQISAMILQQVKSYAEAQLGERVTHAVITVPAYFSQRQKDATREAGRLAGLQVARIINEPTAAALAFGVEDHSDEDKYVLVYDMGGGTFDVSILLVSNHAYDVFNIDGDNFLGGDNFDELLVQEILARTNKQHLANDSLTRAILKNRAEQMKIELTRSSSSTKRESFQTLGGANVEIEVTITREEFEALIEPYVDRSIDIVHRALRGANVDVNEISHVLLVGGTTRIPLIRRKLKDIFGEEKVEIDVDPMKCVALGAAVQTAALLQEELSGEELDPAEITGIVVDELPEIRIADVTSKHIGIETEDGTGLAIIIPKGTLVPTDSPYRREFYTSRFDQQTYDLPIYEVEAATVEEAQSLPRTRWEHVGKVTNDRIPPGSPKLTPIMVELSIDRDGILTVSSYVKNAKDATIIERSLKMGARQLASQDEAEMEFEFWSLYVSVLSEDKHLQRYMSQDQIRRARDLREQAKNLMERNASRREQETLAGQMKEFALEIPAPVGDLFWASYLIANKDVPSVERNELQSMIVQMEQAIARDDVDVANQWLCSLRNKNFELIEKLPGGSTLLKQQRA